MMTIGAFSERTGLRPKTLRYYEEVGLLVPSIRADNGYRQYGDNQIDAALLIHSLRQAGVGIADIRRFNAGDRAEQERLLQEWREEASAKILSLRIARQFLQGFSPQAKHLRLVRWEEPKTIAWTPYSKEALLGRQRGFYVRYSKEDETEFVGEIGYELAAEKAKERGLEESTLVEYPRTLFAAIECNPDRAAPCKPVFAVIRECGFEPIGTPLRHYSADMNERYTLLIPVLLKP